VQRGECDRHREGGEQFEMRQMRDPKWVESEGDATDCGGVVPARQRVAERVCSKRGEWKQFESAHFKIRPMGSVAYKLARVSAGLDDITFTLVPKNEWDVAAGVALVTSGGGFVTTLENTPLECNRRDPLLSLTVSYPGSPAGKRRPGDMVGS